MLLSFGVYVVVRDVLIAIAVIALVLCARTRTWLPFAVLVASTSATIFLMSRPTIALVIQIHDNARIYLLRHVGPTPEPAPVKAF